MVPVTCVLTKFGNASHGIQTYPTITIPSAQYDSNGKLLSTIKLIIFNSK